MRGRDRAQRFLMGVRSPPGLTTPPASQPSAHARPAVSNSTYFLLYFLLSTFYFRHRFPILPTSYSTSYFLLSTFYFYFLLPPPISNSTYSYSTSHFLLSTFYFYSLLPGADSRPHLLPTPGKPLKPPRPNSRGPMEQPRQKSGDPMKVPCRIAAVY